MPATLSTTSLTTPSTSYSTTCSSRSAMAMSSWFLGWFFASFSLAARTTPCSFCAWFWGVRVTGLLFVYFLKLKHLKILKTKIGQHKFIFFTFLESYLTRICFAFQIASNEACVFVGVANRGAVLPYSFTWGSISSFFPRTHSSTTAYCHVFVYIRNSGNLLNFTLLYFIWCGETFVYCSAVSAVKCGVSLVLH